MKRIEKRILTGYQALLTFVLGLMGFTSACNTTAVEYGSPNADFIVKGKIVSIDNKQSLKDIKVVMGYDSTKSDSNGIYEVSNNVFPNDSISFAISFEDVNSGDGIDYLAIDTVVTFIDAKYENGNKHWYSGETSKTLNIELKK